MIQLKFIKGKPILYNSDYGYSGICNSSDFQTKQDSAQDIIETSE